MAIFLPVSASAQDSPSNTPQGAAVAGGSFPRLVTMDRQGVSQGVGLDLAYVAFDDGDRRALRFDLHGEFDITETFGVTANLVLTNFSAAGDADFGSSGVDETGVSNLAVDAFRRIRMSGDFSWILRGGLLLPTGSGGEAAFANISGAFVRLTDLALAIPEGLAVRLGASALYDNGAGFFRADGGLDLFLSNEGDETVDPLFHVNVAGGVHLNPVALAVELVTLGTTESSEQQFLHTLAFSALLQTGRVAPFLSFILPLDEDLRGELWMFSAGASIGF